MAATDESGEARKRIKMVSAEAAGEEKKLESPERKKNYWSVLPPELIIYIMGYLSFDEIAECRMVCQSFNESGKHLLNKEVQRILSEIRTYLNKVDANLPRTCHQWLNMRPRDRKCEDLEDIYKNIRLVYDAYAPYITDNTSCFVAGKILDLGNAMMAFDWRNSHLDLFQLSAELARLTLKAQTHFNGVIIPIILERKRRSTAAILASPAFYGVSNYWPCGVQPVHAPASSARAEKSCLLSTERTNLAEERRQNRMIRGQTRLIASLLTELEAKKALLEAQKATIEAQKVIIDLLKAKK